MPRQKNNSTKRNVILPSIRVTEAERTAIKQKVLDAGLSASEYRRQALLNTVVVVRENAVDVAAVRQLSAIGNNLNQLTRKAHIHDEYDQQRLRDILTRLEAWLDEVIDGS